MTVAYKVDKRSVGQVLKAFDEFPVALKNKHVRIAINAAGGIQKKTAEKFAPKETSLLSKSLAVKAKVPAASRNEQHHSKPAYSVVGPNKNTVRASAVNAKGKTKLLSDKKALKRVLSGGKVKVRKPSRYAHLAERRGKHPSLFMTRASITSQKAAIFVVKKKLGEGAEAEARRIAQATASASRPVQNVSIKEVVR